MTDGLVDEERRLQGRYRLVSPIARGGMAEVWEGIDEILARPVAVKLLHRHLAADDDFRERFRREAVAAARLSHPNVVATYDTGEDGDLPFIVMELVRGRTLRAVLDDGGIGPATAVAVAVQVADALAAAHAAGIVHRDVKPGNILLCDGSDIGAPGAVKVADFGIARAATDNTDAGDLTQPGTVLGTTKYLSPEQVQGGEPDARSDVYALGIVLYEMVTGRPPFAAESPMATAMAHVHSTPMRPRHVRAGIPRSIEAVVLRAIHKDPAARYQSAAELALALRSLDTAADDAVPLVTRDPTPPAGSPAAFGQSERRWLLPAAAILGVAAVLVSIAVTLGGSDVGTILDRDEPGSRKPEPLAIASIDVLDPTDDVEKNDRLDAIRDADESTSWETSRYESREFGGLKKHLGLELDLGRTTTVRQVTVTSPTSGWNAEVYVADTASDDPAAWGKPVASRQDVAGSTTFDGFETEGRYVLVLFTRLGSDNRVEVQTVTVAA